MNFTPSTDLIRLAEALLVAQAHEAMVRPIVEQYEQEILQRHQFKIDSHWLDFGAKEEIILDRKRTFLMSEGDSKTFHSECFAARDAAGLKVSNPVHCPLLVAEDLRIQAENALLDEMGKVLGFEPLAKKIMTIAQRKLSIDLIVGLVSPHLGTAETILQRYAGVDQKAA